VPFQFVNPGFHSGYFLFQFIQIVFEAFQFLRRGDEAPETHASAATGQPPAAATEAVVHAAPAAAAMTPHAPVSVAVTVTHLTHSFVLLGSDNPPIFSGCQTIFFLPPLPSSLLLLGEEGIR